MFPGVFYALLAGFLGAVASSSAKLSLGADYLKGVCETGLKTWGGEERKFRQADQTTACDWVRQRRGEAGVNYLREGRTRENAGRCGDASGFGVPGADLDRVSSCVSATVSARGASRRQQHKTQLHRSATNSRRIYLMQIKDMCFRCFNAEDGLIGRFICLRTMIIRGRAK